MSKFLKLFQKISIVLLISFFVLSPIAHAASQDFSNPAKVVQSFNENMMKSVSESFLKKDFLKWGDGSIVTFVFTACFIVMLAGAFRNFGSPGFLTQLAELGIYSVIVLALLGQGSAYSTMSGMGLGFGQNKGSLDLDIYYGLKETMDAVAKKAFGEGQTEDLWNASVKASELTDNIILAKSNCEQPDPVTQKKCFKSYITTGDYTPVDEEKEESLIESIPGIGAVYGLLKKWGETAARIYNPFTWAFPALFWIVQLIATIVNMFLVIGFGLMSTLSLFFAKLICPLLLLPSQRSLVMKGLKIPLSATLWGFLTQMMVYFSIVITEAIADGGKDAILAAVDSGSFDMAALTVVMTSMAMAQLVIMLIQIVIMFKIPKLAEDLLNLSASSVVGLGADLLSAVGGVARMAGTVAMPALGAMSGALGGAAKVIGGAASPVLGKVSSSFGSGAANLANSTFGADNVNAAREKFNSMSSAMNSGVDRVKGFGNKIGDIASGGSGSTPFSPMGRANQESVDKSFNDFQNSKDSDSSAKGQTRGSSSKGSDGGESGSRWAGLKQAGKAAITETADMAFSSVINPRGIESKFNEKLGSASAVAGSALSAGAMAIDQGSESLAQKAKNLSSHLVRDRSSTAESRRDAFSSVAKTMTPQRDLIGDDLKTFQSIQSRMASGEALTSEDTDSLTALQNNRLSEDQAKIVSDAISQRYDQSVIEAQETGDYSEMLKLSNNVNAGSAVKKKDLINQNSMEGYRKVVGELKQKVSSLQTKSIGNAYLQETVAAQKELSDLVSQGFVNKDVYSQELVNSSGVQTTIGKSVENSSYAQTMSDINSLLDNKNKTSADYDNLKTMADMNKFKINDENLRKRIEQSLSQAGIDYDFKASEANTLDLNKGLSSLAKEEISKDSVIVGSSVFNFDDKNKIMANTFDTGRSRSVDISKLPIAERNLINNQIKDYDDYLIKYNNILAEAPEKAGDYLKEVEAVRKHRDYLISIQTAYNNSKKRK